jgi:ESCRT-II complex subunit VPS22
MLTRSHNGGLISLQELCNHLRQRRKKDREAVTEDDCLRAISKLKVLGSGFEVITIGKKKLVRSVPTELNKDHNQILELAQGQGFVIVEEVQRRLSWTSGRVIDALETLLEEGLAMIDNGHKDGKCRYWFPCVSSVYSSIGSDT